jgi:hypothetical protein
MPFCLWLAAIVVVCGPLAARGDDFHTDMMRATVKLKHDKSTATGFVLYQSRPEDKGGDRSVLVTAAHVLEKTPADETTVIFRRCEAEGVYKKEPVPLPIRKEGRPLWTRHPTEDVAVLVIVPPEKADLSVVPVDLLASDELLRRHTIHPGQAVFCLGYPHRTEANQAGFPILRFGPIASFPLIPAAVNKTFMLSMNTFEGDSGGPVYLSGVDGGNDEKPGDVRLILGLMHGQHFVDEEMVMLYGNSKVRHRLGLGIVVQSAFIRETLALLP